MSCNELIMINRIYSHIGMVDSALLLAPVLVLAALSFKSKFPIIHRKAALSEALFPWPLELHQT